jgi:hypothetical protein
MLVGQGIAALLLLEQQLLSQHFVVQEHRG